MIDQETFNQLVRDVSLASDILSLIEAIPDNADDVQIFGTAFPAYNLRLILAKAAREHLEAAEEVLYQEKANNVRPLGGAS